MLRSNSSVLELLQMMEHFAAVEGLDVAGLRRREAADRPAEMHEVRLDGMRERVHPDFLRETIALTRVAGTASGDDVRPVWSVGVLEVARRAEQRLEDRVDV